MNTTTPRPLKALFLVQTLVLAALLAVSIAIPTAEARVAEGLSACGTEASPCLLEAVAVEAEAAPAAAADAHLASTVSARKMLRMRT